MKRAAILTLTPVAIALAIAFAAGCSEAPEAPEATQPAAAYEATEGKYLATVEVMLVEPWEDGDTVFCEDATGELFAFTGEGYQEGDILTLTMHDSGTPGDRLDDTIQDAMTLEAMMV